MKSSMLIKRSRMSRPFYLLALCALLIAVGGHQTARAQWATNGNNISNTNTGNVGIGTTNPSSPLDVTGGGDATWFTIHNQGSAVGGGILLYGRPATSTPAGQPLFWHFGTRYDGGGGSWPVGALGIYNIISNGAGGASAIRNFMFFDPNGNTIFQNTGGSVGIGTVTPANLLHVENAYGTAAIRVNGSGAGFINFRDAAAAANTKLFQWRSEGGLFRMALVNDAENAYVQQNILVANSTGNVGIGTATPAAALNIVGTSTSNQHVILDAYATGARFQQRRANGSTGSPAAVQSGDVLGNFGFAGYGASGWQANNGSSATIRGMAAENFTDAAQGTSILFQTTPLSSITQVERMRIDAGGNVGIGTSSPSTKLDVNGTINATGLTVNGSPVSGSQWFTSGTSINYGGGNVGIGNSTPSSRLDVNGTVNATGFTVNGAPMTGSQWASSGTSINYSSGNVGIGTANPAVKLDVLGNVNVTGNIVATGNVTATFQDVAEWVPSSRRIAAATVVVLDTQRTNQVLPSTESYDTRVAGVVSARPGIVLGEAGENKVLVATTGRVKVRVDATGAAIHVGDLLVTSDKEGMAMKSEPVKVGGVQMHRPGTLIGKALEPLEAGTGEILVLLSLQ